MHGSDKLEADQLVDVNIAEHQARGEVTKVGASQISSLHT